MLKVRYTRHAQRDLRKILTQIRQEAGDPIAKGFLTRIRSKIARLSHDGPRYRERPELGPGRRAILIGNYMVFYVVVVDAVVIQRVLYGSREITQAVLDEK